MLKLIWGMERNNLGKVALKAQFSISACRVEN